MQLEVLAFFVPILNGYGTKSPYKIDYFLGITTVDSPATLHALLFVKKQKTGRGKCLNAQIIQLCNYALDSEKR